MTISFIHVQGYGPESGMSAEEHKWHCSQAGKIRQRVPEALHKLQAEAEKVRLHFLDDPVALKIWDQYIDDIHCAASRNLIYSLSLYAQVNLQALSFLCFQFHEKENKHLHCTHCLFLYHF